MEHLPRTAKPYPAGEGIFPRRILVSNPTLRWLEVYRCGGQVLPADDVFRLRRHPAKPRPVRHLPHRQRVADIRDPILNRMGKSAGDQGCFSTTLPFSRTKIGSPKRRCSARTFLAALRNARRATLPSSGSSDIFMGRSGVYFGAIIGGGTDPHRRYHGFPKLPRGGVEILSSPRHTICRPMADTDSPGSPKSSDNAVEYPLME